MAEALFWGALASSSLILGGLLALRLRIPMLVLGLIMGFGAGVLISAVAYELVEEAVQTSRGQRRRRAGPARSAAWPSSAAISSSTGSGARTASARTAARPPPAGPRSPSSSGSCSTGSRSRSCSA